jgi:hypothetical protein
LEEPIVVHRSDGTELADVFTYIANPDPDGPYRPSEEYKALIIRGAARWELPNEYQESLSELQVQ